MSKIMIIAIVVAIVTIGSASALLFVSFETPLETNEQNITETQESIKTKGKDIKISLEDGISMSLTP